MGSPDQSFAASFRAALAAGHIVAHFQPIVSLEYRAVVGLEVLARWQDPDRGTLLPAEFVPQAERDSLLDDLLRHLLSATFSAARDWPEHLFVAFNVSPVQLRNPGLPDLIAVAAEAAGFPLSRVHLEITESAVMVDLEHSRTLLDRLVGKGCVIVLDDFGTGYSSLTWLHSLPFGKLKIEHTFVSSMSEQRDSRAIVKAVVALGEGLGLPVVAEGVETAEEAHLLNRMGCRLAQGYFFGAPAAAADVPALLEHNPGLAELAGGRRSGAVTAPEHRAYQISELYRSNDTSIGFISTDGHVIAASERFAQELGLTSDQIVGQHIWKVSATQPARIAEIRTALTLGRPIPSCEHKLPNGRTVLVSLHRVVDETDELLGFSALTVDITERIAAEEELRRSRRQRKETELALRDLTEERQFIRDHARYLSWVISPEGRLISVSRDWQKLSGGTTEEQAKAEVDSGAVFRHIHPDYRDAVWERWVHCLRTGDVFEMEYLCIFPDGDARWGTCHGVPRRDENGEILAWYGTFIPQRVDPATARPA